MWTLLIPVLVVGGLLFIGSKKPEPSGPPIYIGAGEVWSLGFRTTRAMTESDWLALFSLYPGEIMGVTPGAGRNEYVLTARFTESATLPPVGTTVEGPDISATLIFAQRAPVG